MYCSTIPECDVRKSLELMLVPGHVYELRCPKSAHGVISGLFDDWDKLADEASRLSGQVPAVYITLNPVGPALTAACDNRINQYTKLTTADEQILRRYRLLVDCDSVKKPAVGRPSESNASDAEHANALTKAAQVQSNLTSLGFPQPLYADSGNGGHLLYAIDLPNDAASTALVSDFLRALHQKFTDDNSTIDTTVKNASRITKLYGTKVCKAPHTEERPRRMSCILEAPSALTAVPADLLQKVIDEARAADATANNAAAADAEQEAEPQGDKLAWMECFLAKHKIAVQQVKDGGSNWLKRWLLQHCPFCGESDKSATITLNKAGKIGFGCRHNRCKGKKWEDFRKHFEPQWTGGKKQSIVARLIEHAREKCELVFDAEREVPLAKIPSMGFYPLQSRQFKAWLVGSFREATGLAVKGNQLSDALLNVASHCTKPVRTYHRVAAHEGAIYIDTLTEQKVVKITADGWHVIDAESCPVVFVVKRDMAPMPLPLAGGTIKDLAPFVNATEEGFALLVAFLLDSLKGSKPYAILLANGEDGSAKTTLAVFLSWLLDGCLVAKTKSLPRDLQELAVLASNRHLLCFDNQSKLTDEISDALCRVVTGSGMVLRSLYTNADEQIFGGANPIFINGIPEIGDRSDFLSRCLKVNLPPITDEQRLDEGEFYKRFEERRPFILGALYNLVANGLRHKGGVSAARKPRMADTFLWLLACEQGTGLALSESFKANVKENVKGVALDTLLGRAMVDFMHDQKINGYKWQGGPTQLHVFLRRCFDADELRWYPKSANKLSGSLRQLGASLRTNGIDVQSGRKSSGNRDRYITIDASAYFGSAASPSATATEGRDSETAAFREGAHYTVTWLGERWTINLRPQTYNRLPTHLRAVAKEGKNDGATCYWFSGNGGQEKLAGMVAKLSEALQPVAV